MNKSLSMVLVIFMLFGIAWADEIPTRAELSVKLADALQIDSTTLFPLLRYSDWSQIDGSLRLSVSAAIKAGVFAPEAAMLEPNKPIDKADIDTAIFGTLRYVATNEQLEHHQGEIIIKAEDVSTVLVGAKQFTAKNICLFIGDEISSFSRLKTAQKVEFIANKQGDILLGWEPKINSTMVTTVETGVLYLYAEQNNSLIMTNIAAYIDGRWKEKQERYANVMLDPSAILVCDGKRVGKNELNAYFLDRQITFILGGEIGSQKILFVSIR